MELERASTLSEEGTRDDLDKYSKLTQWGAQQEKFERPSDNHSIIGKYNPAFHSLTGTVPVSLPGFPHPASDAVTLEASEQLGGEFKFNLDWNSGRPLGIGRYIYRYRYSN